MAKTLVKELPKWAEPALQGISYWIGWNYARYPHWPLTEGALVAELQRLIASNIDSDEALCAEVNVEDLLNPKLTNDEIRPGRVDIVLVKKIKGQRLDAHRVREDAVAIIEVKRSGPWNKIEEDIVRLSCLERHLGDSARSFVIITSQAKSFGKHFAKDGVALKPWQSLGDAEYKVRRLCRATAALSGRSSSHCACIIEVRARARHRPE
jgi:hypothetical protein